MGEPPQGWDLTVPSTCPGLGWEEEQPCLVLACGARPASKTTEAAAAPWDVLCVVLDTSWGSALPASMQWASRPPHTREELPFQVQAAHLGPPVETLLHWQT